MTRVFLSAIRERPMAGATWTARTGSETLAWRAITCSDDGQRIMSDRAVDDFFVSVGAEPAPGDRP